MNGGGFMLFMGFGVVFVEDVIMVVVVWLVVVEVV